ncbi:MAG: bifunctional glutamate N-acetyltransferase/amino-acid acetyltransferase ArgJ [Propionibacteriaceae bacterium]|nr:bifunctional glutamate N-acetyltransferase/amino-acid acetyltransferase ArgJ [Propionibacteriaceae bacterium]
MSVTYPAGFTAAATQAGQKSSGAADLAIVVNTGPAPAAAGVFTPNRFCAAPVRWSREVLALGGTPKVVVFNAGGANACTGDAGYADTEATAREAAACLGLTPTEVLVGSTGLIGKRLNMTGLLLGIAAASTELAVDGGQAAAEAIITTDTHPKTTQAELAGGWRVGGMAKGAGMIAPGMATLLVVITTDAVTDNATAQRAIAQAAELTFNRIDTDGCMSTNDTLLLLASGASGVRVSEAELTNAVARACFDLAQQCVGDAEGASHDIAINVVNAATETGALAVARAVARSNLFKCAVFGNDPNWGRILSAAGTVPADIAPYEPTQVDVSINGVMICRGGGIGEPRELVDMTARRVEVIIDLKAGDQAATIYTNDLTYDYVKENAEYPT